MIQKKFSFSQIKRKSNGFLQSPINLHKLDYEL